MTPFSKVSCTKSPLLVNDHYNRINRSRTKTNILIGLICMLVILYFFEESIVLGMLVVKREN
jgi:hypothetical protein